MTILESFLLCLVLSFWCSCRQNIAAVIDYSIILEQPQPPQKFSYSSALLVARCFNGFAEVFERKRLPFVSIAAMPIANVIIKNMKISKTWRKTKPTSWNGWIWIFKMPIVYQFCPIIWILIQVVVLVYSTDKDSAMEYNKDHTVFTMNIVICKR